MVFFISEDECTGCGACVSICHFSAIVMKKNQYGFDVPVINENKCVNC